MRGLQGSFPCCKKRLPSNNYKQRLIIESIILIHNFRTVLVGSNQIRTVFDPEYERIINLEGYDRISHYYMCPEDFDSSNSSDSDESDCE